MTCGNFSADSPALRARTIQRRQFCADHAAPALPSMKRDLQPLARVDIRIGAPIPFPVYDRSGRLLLARGQVVADPRALDSLVARGLYVNPRWSRGEGTLADTGGEQPVGNEQPAAEFRGLPPLTNGKGKVRKSREIPAWRLLRMWSEGGSADDAMTVKLVGVHEGKSIVITAPERDGRLAFVKEGVTFFFSGFSGELVYEFNALVQKVRFDPYPYLHIGWPHDWQVGKRRVREARRVRTDVPCILYRDSQSTSNFVKGVLTNLSTGGASLQLKDPIHGLEERVRLAFRVEIAGQQKLFEIDAKPVRLPEADDLEPSIGLSFLDLDEAQRMALHAFVYLQLVREMEMPLLAD